jgi:hypothetical protein
VVVVWTELSEDEGAANAGEPEEEITHLSFLLLVPPNGQTQRAS